MTRLIILAFFALAVLGAGATAVLRPRSPLSGGMAAMPTIQQLHSSANVDKLKAEDFEDRSSVFPS